MSGHDPFEAHARGEWAGSDGYWQNAADGSDVIVSRESSGQVCLSVSSGGAPYQSIWLTQAQWRALCALPVLSAAPEPDRG